MLRCGLVELLSHLKPGPCGCTPSAYKTPPEAERQQLLAFDWGPTAC